MNMEDWHERYEALAAVVKDLFEVLDAHELDTYDCDRAGVVHCDCLVT